MRASRLLTLALVIAAGIAATAAPAFAQTRQSFPDKPIRHQISNEVGRILDLPEIKTRLENMAYNIAPSTPEEHDRAIRADIKSFSEIARRLGLIEK